MRQRTSPQQRRGSLRTNVGAIDGIAEVTHGRGWLLNDDCVSAQVIFPRVTSHSHAKLKDPQIVLLETTKGIRIDVEVFVNCRYGYDIQCQVVGEEGLANLPEPMSIVMRKDAKLQNAILTDWKDRFIDSYDVELQDFIEAAASGTASGPTSWDGYVAAITSVAMSPAFRATAPAQ